MLTRGATFDQEISDMAFYELRQYKVLPGKMDEWVKIMEEEIIPFQVSKGMVITGSYRGETDDSCYVWMRRFDSEAAREALYKAVYDSDYWKTKIAPRVPQCLDRSAMVVTRIVPTPKSTAQ
jgi:NIPSNAP